VRSIPRRVWSALGPGLITGAADDDPSGIATYSVAGAQLGTGLLWTALLTWPMMAAVQSMCARIGMVTGPLDAYVMVRVNTAQDLSQLLDRLTAIPGVASVQSAVVVAGGVVVVCANSDVEASERKTASAAVARLFIDLFIFVL